MNSDVTNYNKVIENYPKPVSMTLRSSGLDLKSRKPVTQTIKVKNDEQFICTICNAVFSSIQSLAIHKKNHPYHKPHKCANCDKEFSQRSLLIAHTRTHTGERPFACDECAKRFLQSDHLRKHKRIHSGVKPYKCTECSKEYSDGTSLRHHMKHHTDPSPLICKYCQLLFDKQSAYAVHVMRHEGLQPEECDTCRKVFPTKATLLAHRRLHLIVKPFSCALCAEKFTRTVSLRKHMKYFHEYNWEKTLGKSQTKKSLSKLACNLCDKVFVSSRLYLEHHNSHQLSNKFKCEKRKQVFANKITLEFHEEMHESETPADLSIPEISAILPGLSSVQIVPVCNYDQLKWVDVNDPLAIATAAAQVTPNCMDNFELCEQPTYVYYIRPSDPSATELTTN